MKRRKVRAPRKKLVRLGHHVFSLELVTRGQMKELRAPTKRTRRKRR